MDPILCAVICVVAVVITAVVVWFFAENFHKNSAPGKVLILLTEKGCFLFIGHGELHKYLSFPFCSSC